MWGREKEEEEMGEEVAFGLSWSAESLEASMLAVTPAKQEKTRLDRERANELAELEGALAVHEKTKSHVTHLRKEAGLRAKMAWDESRKREKALQKARRHHNGMRRRKETSRKQQFIWPQYNV